MNDFNTNNVELATQKSKKTKAKKAKKSDIELIIEGEEQYTNDISGLANINELYESSPIKKWIKVISTEKTILLDEYNRKDHFIPIADIVLDSEVSSSGNKKRNTLIQFVPRISNELFNKKTEWLYLLVINDRIVKIGGTRTGLKGRVSSLGNTGVYILF